MSDFIKREDAIDIMKNLKRFSCFGDDGFVQIPMVYCELMKVAPADVAPFSHGHWIKHDPHCDGLAFLWNCSKCGAESEEGYRYCPACGARMDAKE